MERKREEAVSFAWRADPALAPVQDSCFVQAPSLQTQEHQPPPPMRQTWLQRPSQNGCGTQQSLKDAAEWDRKSAVRGYNGGLFNYGLNLLQGFSVKQREAAGRAMIDAAAQGLDSARRSKDTDYDTGVVMPDADEQRVY